MKKITLLLVSIMLTTLGFSQATHTVDFEPSGTGNGWSWTVADNAPILTEKANPVSGGINTSATVLEFVAHTTDMNWALCHTDDNNTFTFDGTNSTVKIMVYKTSISKVAIKFEGTSGTIELGATNTVVNQWEELSYDFSGQIGNTYDKIVIIPDFVEPYVDGTDRTTDNTLYFDNIQLPEGTVIETCSDGILNNGETEIDCGGSNCEPCAVEATPPTTAAPTPPARDAADVVSIYSDAYAAISPINYDEAWCGAGAITGTTADGNAIIKYNDKACQGIGFAGDMQDFTGMTNVHVDLFIAVGTDLVGKVFNLKIVPSVGAETSFNIDINALDPAPVPGTWYSYDQEITITGAATDIKQFGITSNLAEAVWYDNLYFYKSNATAETCDDGIQNNEETGVDCGGPNCEPCKVAEALNIDFETEITTAGFTNFDGGTATVIANPQGSGIVGQIVRDGGAIWAGAYLTLVNSPDFSILKGVRMKLWTEAPIGTKISIKTEGGSGSGDKDAYTTVTGAWETLEYDFTGAPSNDTKLTFLFDFGNVGDGTATSTFLFDDIEQFDPSLAGTTNLTIERLSVYPNPTQDKWQVRAEKDIIKSVDIYNALGERVISIHPNSKSIEVDASNLTSGMYLSKITTKFGIETKVLIKK